MLDLVLDYHHGDKKNIHLKICKHNPYQRALQKKDFRQSPTNFV